ncbi:hypothetical protein PSDI105340_12000 [Pseudoalteromonas distincta]
MAIARKRQVSLVDTKYYRRKLNKLDIHPKFALSKVND